MFPYISIFTKSPKGNLWVIHISEHRGPLSVSVMLIFWLLSYSSLASFLFYLPLALQLLCIFLDLHFHSVFLCTSISMPRVSFNILILNVYKSASQVDLLFLKAKLKHSSVEKTYAGGCPRHLKIKKSRIEFVVYCSYWVNKQACV